MSNQQTIITITAADLSDIRVSINPPGTPPTVVAPLLFEALLGEVIRSGMPGNEFARILREYAKQIEAMTDQKYFANHQPSTVSH